MPIRFRCEFCKQLLGIARRKAGSTVRCPTCQNEVMVPARDAEFLPEPEEAPGSVPGTVPTPGTAPESPAAGALFERDDFEAILEGAVSQEPSRSVAAASVQAPVSPGRVPLPPPAVRDLKGWPSSPSGPGPPPLPGLVLTQTRATVLTVAVVVLLAVSFVLGLLVGRFCLGV
jgi:phage FluMu protein Com